MAACGDRLRRVEEDRRAPAAVSALEHLADLRSVRRRVAAAELLRVAARDAEVERVDLAPRHAALYDLADEVRPGRGELVDSARSVHDERTARVELCEDVGDHRHE